MDEHNREVTAVVILCVLIPLLIPLITWFLASFGDTVMAVLVPRLTLPFP